MTRITPSLVVVGLLVLPAAASAQRFEVGASIGAGTAGTENSLAGGNTTIMPGVRASVWWGDRLETGIRLAWWPIPNPHGSAGYSINCGDGGPSTCDFFYVNFDRVTPRLFVAGEALYHFRRGSRLRPFVGGGYGRMDSSENVTCETPGCEVHLTPGFRFGRRQSSATDIIVIGGVSWTLTNHLRLRGAVRMHRPGGEDLSTAETSVGLGVRF